MARLQWRLWTGVELSRVPREGTTIDAVVDRLAEIIDVCRRDRSRLGYFAVLYRAGTLQVREGTARGGYEDGSRMERLATIFAHLYLDAVDRFQRGETVNASWRT